MEKGEYLGKCNLSSCTSGQSATWYNHSTRKWYCKGCAMRLNSDPYNERDAQRLYGHELCTNYLSQVHLMPMPDKTGNVRCLNGSAHIKETTDLSKVTCPLCLDENTHKEYWIEKAGQKAI